MTKPFWEVLKLEEMTQTQWESLCDGCGKCCLNKLEDWDTGEILWTNLGCELLDCDTCRCKDYENRASIVSDCIQLTPEKISEIGWLPPTCAYRLVKEGRPLYWWHPLVSGDPQTVREAGVSVQGRAIPDDGIKPEDYEDHLVDWPLEEYLEKNS